MTAKLYVRDGGTEAASVIDVSEFAPSFEGKQPLIELGMSFQNGAASQGTFRTNPTGIFGTPGGVIAPHAQVTWTEDASGDELWLARGRTSGEEEGRGIALAEDIVEHVVTVDDANVDTRGLAFTEDWVRPAETDTARLYALDAYILSGASSTSPTLRFSTDITASGSHLAPDTETVTMPAKTYPAGTQPSEVINDCAESASKVWGVVIHHTGGASHLCLLYIKELDHSTFASACKISDQVANWDPEDLTAPVFEPIWDQGKGLVFGAQSAVSGILNRYGNGDQFIYVNNPTLEDQNEHWIDSFSDSDSVTATQAEARANAILSYRSFGDFTYRASVIVLPEQTHLLGAGMSLGVDTAVFPGGTFRGDYENVRIVQLTWEPIPDGRYFAHMQLNRTLRTLAPSRGKVQPSATTPESAPVCAPDTIISPTTIYSWQFTADNEDDATSTYSIGLERTVSGGFGDYPPANSAFGTHYGRNNAGSFLSVDLPITAGQDYTFRTDILWRYTPSTRNVDVRWHDVGSALLQTDRWISGAGHATNTEYNEIATFTAPVGAVTCQVFWTNFAGVFADNVFIETPGSIIPADNDPFCVVDPGDSPYYVRSDDPRLDALDARPTWSAVVAADDTTDELKAIADYVCEGADDDVTINAAIAAGVGSSATVHLLPGTYVIGAAIDFTPWADTDTDGTRLVFDARSAHIRAGANLTTMVDMAPGVGLQLLNKLHLEIGRLDGRKGTYTVTQGVLMHRASDNHIWFGDIYGMSGIGFNVTQSGITDYGCFNNDIEIARLNENTGTAFNVTSSTTANVTGFQGNLVKTGQVSVNGNGFVIGDATNDNAILNTFIAAPIEANTTYGVNDQCGENIWIINNTNTNGTAGIFCPTGMTKRSTFIVTAHDTIHANVTDQHQVINAGNFAGIMDWAEKASSPGTPNSGFGRWYNKTDGKAYFKNDAGTEYDLTGGGTVDPDDVRDAGIWEVIVSGTAPPVAVTNEAEDDWVYGWVPG